VLLKKFSMLVVDVNRPVSRDYEATIEKVYDADVFPVDFRDVVTTERVINGNVSAQTQGLITDTVTREDLFKV
jgi:serine protease inhibitor